MNFDLLFIFWPHASVDLTLACVGDLPVVSPALCCSFSLAASTDRNHLLDLPRALGASSSSRYPAPRGPGPPERFTLCRRALAICFHLCKPHPPCPQLGTHFYTIPLITSATSPPPPQSLLYGGLGGFKNEQHLYCLGGAPRTQASVAPVTKARAGLDLITQWLPRVFPDPDSGPHPQKQPHRHVLEQGKGMAELGT